MMKKAQSTLEFTFGVVVTMFIIYGLVQVFRWAGMDLAQRRWAQDSSMVTLTGQDPASELDSNIDVLMPMSAVYHGNVSNGT
jgi:hypothetical protein